MQTIRSNPTGWIVVGVCFLALSVVSATRASLGLVMPSLESELGWSRGFVSSVAAYSLITMAVTAPFVGNLLDRHGPRVLLTVGLAISGVGLLWTSMVSEPWQFVVGYALLAGMGFGVISKGIVGATIALYFVRDRGLAIGISSGGSTAGHLTLLPLLAVMLVFLGWRYGYVMLAVTSFALIPLTWFLLRGRGGVRREGEENEPRLPLKARLSLLVHNRTYIALAGSYAICGFTTAGVVETHLLPYTASCGIPVVVGASAYGVLAVFNMVGMALAGYLSDRMNRSILLAAIYILRAFSFLILMQLLGSDVSLLFLFAVLFGLFDYSTIPVTTSLVASHLGTRVVGLAVGGLAMFHASGAAAGAFMGGILYDLFNKYDWVWIVSLVLAFLAGLIVLTIRDGPDDRREERGQGVPEPEPTPA
jgi:MFS family permease